jgi:hypothetical protein
MCPNVLARRPNCTTPQADVSARTDSHAWIKELIHTSGLNAACGRPVAAIFLLLVASTRGVFRLVDQGLNLYSCTTGD